MSTADLTQPMNIDDASFDIVTAMPDKLVLVDFWAPWCGPCKAIAPTLAELAAEYDGKLVVAKLNIDEHQQKATAFAVRSIPTMVLFRDGEMVDTITGALPKNALKSKIDAQMPA